jgi:pimeloyl-ACP methyl ester carboxylesterase
MKDNPKIAKLYEDVPDEALNRLQKFRERYPYQTISLNGNKWRFIDTQEGAKTLFVLAGSTTIAEVSFLELEHFAARYRVISPDYPATNNLNELFDGYEKLFTHLGIENFCAMGGAYGGWIAQSLVRQYKELISKLVLAKVGPPDKENNQQLAKTMRWIKLTPTSVLRASVNRSFSQMDSSDSADPDQLLLKALTQEALLFKVQRVDILSSLERLIDQTKNYSFSAGDLKDWLGTLLLLFSKNDPATPPEMRQAMEDLYPQAEVKLINGSDASAAQSEQVEFFKTVDDFLAR